MTTNRDEACRSCPRQCGADRRLKMGACGVGRNPVLARAGLHLWEEPCISGSNGSGIVFFSGCNLKCVFCQNHRISHERFGKEISIERLSEIFLELQEKGAHNINLVSPSHYTEAVCEALDRSAGLKLPVIYNSNGYDSLEALEALKGKIDIYLPDLKYYSPELAQRYSGVRDYFEVASKAILKMTEQVGAPVFGEDGLMKRGLMVRHLVLPGSSSDSILLMDWYAANLPKDIYLSLMCQYYPVYRAAEIPEINRRLTRWEYDRVVGHVHKLGLVNGYTQERGSAESEYTPEFNLEGV